MNLHWVSWHCPMLWRIPRAGGRVSVCIAQISVGSKIKTIPSTARRHMDLFMIWQLSAPKPFRSWKYFNIIWDHITWARFSMPTLLSGKKWGSFKASGGKNSLPWTLSFPLRKQASVAPCLLDSRPAHNFCPSSQKLKLTLLVVAIGREVCRLASGPGGGLGCWQEQGASWVTQHPAGGARGLLSPKLLFNWYYFRFVYKVRLQSSFPLHGNEEMKFHVF